MIRRALPYLILLLLIKVVTVIIAVSIAGVVPPHITKHSTLLGLSTFAIDMAAAYGLGLFTRRRSRRA